MEDKVWVVVEEEEEREGVGNEGESRGGDRGGSWR